MISSKSRVIELVSGKMEKSYEKVVGQSPRFCSTHQKLVTYWYLDDIGVKMYPKTYLKLMLKEWPLCWLVFTSEIFSYP